MFLVRDKDMPDNAWLCYFGKDRTVHAIDYVKIEFVPPWLQRTLDDKHDGGK